MGHEDIEMHEENNLKKWYQNLADELKQYKMRRTLERDPRYGLSSSYLFPIKTEKTSHHLSPTVYQNAYSKRNSGIFLHTFSFVLWSKIANITILI